MVKIRCLGNGLYSLKNSHIPFGQGFQPPPPYGQRQFEQCFSCAGASQSRLTRPTQCKWLSLHFVEPCSDNYSRCDIRSATRISDAVHNRTIEYRSVLRILHHATIISKVQGCDLLSGFCKAYPILSLSLVSWRCNFKQSSQLLSAPSSAALYWEFSPLYRLPPFILR